MTMGSPSGLFVWIDEQPAHGKTPKKIRLKRLAKVARGVIAREGWCGWLDLSPLRAEGWLRLEAFQPKPELYDGRRPRLSTFDGLTKIGLMPVSLHWHGAVHVVLVLGIGGRVL